MIRARRMSRGMTQEQLGDAIDMSASAIAMYEAGRRRPKDNVAEALADVFNVPKWAIYYSEDEMAPKEEPMDDDEMWQLREDFRRNPELRTVLSLARNASKKEMKQIEAIIRTLRSSNEYEEDDTP